VALGFAYMSSGDLKSAKEYTLTALEIVPSQTAHPAASCGVFINPFALRNLGGIFGMEDDYLNAFYQLQKAYNILGTTRPSTDLLSPINR
jgi:tetratricopeptide (TPR) repeat protein